MGFAAAVAAGFSDDFAADVSGFGVASFTTVDAAFASDDFAAIVSGFGVVGFATAATVFVSDAFAAAPVFAVAGFTAASVFAAVTGFAGAAVFVSFGSGFLAALVAGVVGFAADAIVVFTGVSVFGAAEASFDSVLASAGFGAEIVSTLGKEPSADLAETIGATAESGVASVPFRGSSATGSLVLGAAAGTEIGADGGSRLTRATAGAGCGAPVIIGIAKTPAPIAIAQISAPAINAIGGRRAGFSSSSSRS